MLLSRPSQARDSDAADRLGAEDALIRGSRRFGGPLWLRCELYAASCRLSPLFARVKALYALYPVNTGVSCMFCCV